MGKLSEEIKAMFRELLERTGGPPIQRPSMTEAPRSHSRPWVVRGERIVQSLRDTEASANALAALWDELLEIILPFLTNTAINPKMVSDALRGDDEQGRGVAIERAREFVYWTGSEPPANDDDYFAWSLLEDATKALARRFGVPMIDDSSDAESA